MLTPHAHTLLAQMAASLAPLETRPTPVNGTQVIFLVGGFL